MVVIAAMNLHHETVELQQLRYAVAVAEEESFTKAAARCFVVQSALSHQIKALEHEIGVELFARTSRKVEITEAGKAFVEAARQSIAVAEGAALAAAAAAGQVKGSLSIGVIPTVGAVDLPVLLADFHLKYPDVRFRLRGGSSEQFIEGVKAGEFDVAFLGLAKSESPSGVASLKLSQERLVAALPAGHALAGKRNLELKHLAGERFVDFPARSAGRIQTDQAFRNLSLDRDVVIEATSVDQFVAFIRHGLGIAMLPAGSLPSDGSIIPIEVADGPQRTEFLAWNDFNPTPATVSFVEAVRHQMGKQNAPAE